MSKEDTILIISLLEGSAGFAGHLVSLLSFPIIYKSLHFSISPYSLDEGEITDNFYLDTLNKLNKCANFQKIVKLSEKHPKILILEDIVDSGETLKLLLKILSNYKHIKEIKCATLFVKINNKLTSSFFEDKFYRPLFFPTNYIGSILERKQREFNLKDWTEDNSEKLFN
ncbi:hypothetical protein PVNG_02413 [Plasmodium vivax North Korean]|uniref:Phosphoribosyltransferase domain-containing protein n=1 Tax=Plasmodium vivax North Korean TaxID=1035514 RepID=A0A0J9TKL8_PLAVI|nr:hypothetical protein PVNG_02413 [Plasmodium vivax North Korean]